MVNKSNIVLGCLGLERDTVEMVALGFKNESLSYMAPEILDEDDYTEKIDIWSFGCVLYEMIELEKLFHSSSVQTLNDISKFDTFKLKIANMSALYQITIRK